MFLQRTIAAITAHAIAEYPKESCGVVAGGQYVPLENRHAKPEEAFEIEPEIFARYGAGLQAIVHSHPDDWPVPTADDMVGQRNTALPWGIVAVAKDKAGIVVASPPTWFGPGVPKAPLIGRGFIHGIQDCFSLLLDWHAAAPRKLEFPEFPRTWQWWHGEADLYRDYFRDYGCEPIKAAEPGAVGLVAIGKNPDGSLVTKPNHGLIMLRNDLFLHHLSGRAPIDPARISAREPWSRWQRHWNAAPIWIKHRDMTPAMAEGGL